MTIQYGRRIIWPSLNGIEHWEIRKGYTLPNYQSKTFIDCCRDMEEVERKLNTGMPIHDALDTIYRTSCETLFTMRFDCYNGMLPAQSYRRTSLDFQMQSIDNYRIGAFVDRRAPELINIHLGTVLSVEDLCHSLMALWENPLGLTFSHSLGFPLRHQFVDAQFNDNFIDYTQSHVGPARFDALKAAGKLNQPDLLDEMPRNIINNFLVTSTQYERQMFADHLSTMALNWVISHEDAHKYLGHLQYFETMGIHDQDIIFSELVSLAESPEQALYRRMAELEADTCATMRAVDICFDNEFLAITSDLMSIEVVEQIYYGKKRSSEFDERQRLFLMRLITLSAVIPLIAFDYGANRESAGNTNSYPSFLTRALNICLTIALRCIDTTNYHPEVNVGTFGLTEFQFYFYFALQDIRSAYQILTHAMNREYQQAMPSFMMDLELMGPLLTQMFHDYAGKPYLNNGIDVLAGPHIEEFAAEIYTLLDERHQMFLLCPEVFFDAKMQANASREDKVIEDRKIYQQRVKLDKAIFDFL